MLELRARTVEERLMSLTDRVRDIRGLILVDANGLPLVSTFGSGALEDSLTAYTGAVLSSLQRARQDLATGPVHLLHLAGRDRQVFVTPLSADVTLAALVDGGACASSVTLHLLALTREILELVRTPDREAVT